MEIADQIIEQLRQLQVMMQRIAFHCTGSTPYRGRGRILSLLRETPVTSQKELANQLDISKQALAELLLKMERAGLITRRTGTAVSRRSHSPKPASSPPIRSPRSSLPCRVSSST